MAPSDDCRLTVSATTYLIHHVVLPPKLPQEDDYNASHEQCLLDAVICALQDLRDSVSDRDMKEAITSAVHTIENLQDSRDKHGDVSEIQLLKLFQKLASASTVEMIPLEIKAQNAGLIISRRADSVYFEPFELSPSNKAAMGASGRLIRTFPGSAFQIPSTTMKDGAFRDSLAYTLAKMATQAAPGFQPQVQKNGQLQNEDRDTTDPALVTDWLMNYVSTLGVMTKTVCISKRTREEVLWYDCKQPWRRSPMWLLVRVTLQLHFTQRGSTAQPLDGLYKVFVAQLLSHILDSAKANWTALGSDTLYVISAKLARRVHKLENLGQLQPLHSHWTTELRASMLDAHTFINKNWAALTKLSYANTDTDPLHNLQPANDIDMSLPEVDAFLARVAARRRDTADTVFKPDANYPAYPPHELPASLTASGDHKYFRIAALEAWIEQHLQSWLVSCLRDGSTCGRLRGLMQMYHTVANSAYAELPVSLSVMYLSLLELWVACDKSACQIYPLLCQYDPELNLDELQCLVLPLKSQMHRLEEIERYVKLRRDGSNTASPSVFRNFGNSSSFAVKYFDQSIELQELLSNITRDATMKQQQKRNELVDLKAQYNDLINRYNNRDCETHEVVYNRYHGYTITKHKPSCTRCALKRKADRLSIQIYEWPLSSDEATAKATVFELRSPQAFADWRDASMFLVADVLRCRKQYPNKPQFQYTLDQHHDLRHILSQQYYERRIVPLSQIKSHTATHRKQKKAVINLRDDDVCLPNALRYAYFDKSLGAYTETCGPTGDIVQKCMYRMPSTRSKALERFLYRPPSSPDGMPPNEVIASLSNCPAHFSIDEYKCFGMLPLGRNIVYSNILAQLATSTIDFAKAETQTLILQVIEQAGISNGIFSRSSHASLTEVSFCHAMLQRLEVTLRRVAGNWESWRAVATFIALSRRTLSLTSSPEVRTRSLGFLFEARQTSIEWLNRLKHSATTSTDDEQRKELYSRATEIALLCLHTFDVENDFIDEVLQQQSATCALLQCSIMVQENHDTVESESQMVYHAMLQSWRSLLYRMFPRLRHHILQGDTGLHAAVLKNWADFQPEPGQRWNVLSEPHEHWLRIKSGSLAVYFNLLTAELLVNGLPLARLPPEFIQHPLYVPLFGKSTLEVVPTDWPGMNFSAKSKYRDHRLHFGMGGPEMHVVAIQGNSTLDLLPSWSFKDRLPFAFIRDYIHWYDHDRNEIIFRPRDDPWSSNSAEWRLIRQGSAWRLIRGVNALVNIFSYTARTLSIIFSSLEDARHIHVTMDTTDSGMHIQIPRLQLDFQLELGNTKITSRQYRGMIVDPVQTIGTLVGLTSKLVLKPADHLEDRLVLIPVPRTFGACTITCVQDSSQHVSVNIDKDEAHKVYAYSLDSTLGRILDSGDVQRRLFIALLHALTSHCLPDLLTGYTGTESALNIMQSAAVRSFEYLTADNVNLLHRIASISPLRSFYPAHLMEMQKIEWDWHLPSLSQHPQLRTCALSIIHQAHSMRLFYPDSMPDTSDWKSSNPHLEARDAIRGSTFRVSGYGAEYFTSAEDNSYAARDVYTQSDRGQRAFIAAAMIVRDEAALHSSIPNLKGALLQKHFRGATVKGASRSFDTSELCFDSRWLADSSSTTANFWCDIHSILPVPLTAGNKYDIMAWLSTMAFATSADMSIIQAFAAFYRLRSLGTIKPPQVGTFDLSDGHTWQVTEVRTIVQNCVKSFDESEEAKLPKQDSETDNQHDSRIQALFQNRREGATEAFVADLKMQWPRVKPSAPSTSNIYIYIDVQAAMLRITAKFTTWYHNRLFHQYLENTSELLARQNVLAISTPVPVLSAPLKKRNAKSECRMFSVNNVLAAVPPVIMKENASNSMVAIISPPCEPKLPVQDLQLSTESAQMNWRLEQLCESLRTVAKSKCEKDYVEDLRASCTSLQGIRGKNFDLPSTSLGNDTQKLFQQYLGACQGYFDGFNLALAQAVASNSSLSDEIGLMVQHSPRISPTFWLSQLHRDRFDTLPEAWRVAIIEYGLAVTQLHRAQRLVAVSTKPADLMEELGHVGHSNWDPKVFPETLLLEAESGILVRREQEFIASHMRNPEDANNIVLQLLMGGGKSSTIVPILATYLTDKEKLVRIIVAKPQSKQMLQMLVSKLGYLLNRRVYHMPFSRTLRPTIEEAIFLRKIYEDCIENRGVLLIQPEHILSFKLMAVEAVLAGQACAQSLLATQQFFDKVSRDIVDESDENFSVKFELIYTMGSQRSIEFAPERWLVIQAIAGLIPRFAKQIQEELPRAIEVERNDNGRFPRVRVLRKKASHQLLLRIATHVVEYGITGLPTSTQPVTVQAALLRYITEPDLTAEEIEAVEGSRFWTESTKSPLLLVRGLIAGGILHFALYTKRWRVNFGLDPGRIPETQLAVPFKSKDRPSPRSEFSHPDIVIFLTLLSYYYGGLTDEQLFDSFAHLLKSDQAVIQYDEWVSSASSNLPAMFRQMSGVSLKDSHQCIVELFPSLRFSKKAIDYYLSFLVFPKAMKEFPKKLSASGWDIGAIKTHAVTGFSGTNDTLHLLPLTVRHLDLPSQKHTNALVLQYLLQDETSVELLPPRTRGTDAEHILSLVVAMQPEVRVILDCGASIIEQNNQQVADAWLWMRDDSIQAVVFFNDEELSVLDRAGRIEPLQTSPFAKHLDVCLVYLDEAHTRGTDLKLPRHYRAAVTLGQGLVKDKLTQGCMRMRKLGVGQSVAFVVPEEISTKIREHTGKPSDVPVQVNDVLCWSIGETWQDLKISMPLWAVQGERFERNQNLLCGAATTYTQAELFLEDEAQTLEARYKPRTQEENGMGILTDWDMQNENIGKIITRCQEFEAMGFSAATLSEEQERELAPEMEEERQVERPPRLEAECHNIHPDLQRLVLTGQIVANSRAFKRAFQALCTTSAARLFELEQFPTDLLVTADFMRTVKPPAGSSRETFISDSYQRPVQFVLSVYNTEPRSCIRVEYLIIISPFEADQLLATIRKEAKVTLHIFAPRTNFSFDPLDKLELYNVGCTFSPDQVPRSLTMQLNLFTGSLYLRSYEEYKELCDFLGLLRSVPEEGQQVYPDGFIDPPAGKWGLTMTPVRFFRTLLMKIRCEGEGVEKTHLGRILNGVRLEEADFETDNEMAGT